MKYTIHLIFLLLIGGLSIMSCSKDCTNSTLAVTSLEAEYNCENTMYQIDVNLDDTYTIIRSQSEFADLVTGSCSPTIDFDSYDLIIGKKGLTSGVQSINYTLTEICATGNYQLDVSIQHNLTTEAPNITYHALIPKLGDEQTVEVELDLLYEE